MRGLLLALVMGAVVILILSYKRYLDLRLKTLTELSELLSRIRRNTECYMSATSPVGLSRKYPILESVGLVADTERGVSISEAFIRHGGGLSLSKSAREIMDELSGAGASSLAHVLDTYRSVEEKLASLAVSEAKENEEKIKVFGGVAFALLLGLSMLVL